jgi:hypothetical protein
MPLRYHSGVCPSKLCSLPQRVNVLVPSCPFALCVTIVQCVANVYSAGLRVVKLKFIRVPSAYVPTVNQAGPVL